MQAEIEAKFLEVDHTVLRQRLTEIGATCLQSMREMRRMHYDLPGLPLKAKNSFVRLRDEGDKVTLSYKQVQNLGADGTKEICVVVDGYDMTAEFLEAAGLVQRSYHQTRRESWAYQGVEIELDEWPAIQPLAEIEAPNETRLWEMAAKLGLDHHETMHGTGDYLYAHIFDVTTDEVNAWPKITFADTPLLLKNKRRKKAMVVS